MAREEMRYSAEEGDVVLSWPWPLSVHSIAEMDETLCLQLEVLKRRVQLRMAKAEMIAAVTAIEEPALPGWPFAPSADADYKHNMKGSA